MLPPPTGYDVLSPGPWWVWLLWGLAQLAVFAWGFWKLRRAWERGRREVTGAFGRNRKEKSS